MYSKEIHFYLMNELLVFTELTSDKLKSLLSLNSPYRDVLSLVKEMNTRIIYENVPASEAHIKMKNFPFKSFGYKSPKDFKLFTTTGDKADTLNVSVTPLCCYVLEDNFTLNPAPDKRSKIILGLLADEFERIKQRAIHFLSTDVDEKQLKLYASKNRQFVKTCFHNHTAHFHDLFTIHPDYLNNPDAFIHFYLNFFLIRLRLFYEKFFEDYLGPGKKNEKQLLAELFQVNPALMVKRKNIVRHTLDDESEMTCSEKVTQSYDTDTSLALAYETIGKEHNISADTLKMLLNLNGRFTWKDKINILGDAIYQLMQKKDAQGKPILDLSPDVMASLVSTLFVDSNGNHLSKATIRTYLQPCKADKRPKEGSKSKIVLKNNA